MSHEVVIIGAGYAGLPAAKRLARQVRPDAVTVTLISAFGEFIERPRLHQLSVGQDIESIPLSQYLRRSDVHLTVASVTGIDLDARELRTTDARGGRNTVRYDTLVYALGSNIDVTSAPGVAEHCVTLVGRSAATDLHTRLTELVALSDRADSGALVTVCGGGLTGIETVAEIAATFPRLQTQLVSAGAPGGWLSDKGRHYLDRTLAELGVAVVDEARIAHVEATRLVLADGRHLPFDLCVWAGGFTVPALARRAGLAVNAADRALVDATLRSVSHPDVYVIGDAAAIAGPWGEQLAMGCRTGGFTGPKVADIIAARLTGREPAAFGYRYIHECISLGRRHGLVQFLDRDETPKNRILTGRTAIAYKNATLNGAKLLFRHSGPIAAHRRHVRSADADHAKRRSWSGA
jgi:NADH:ubiquinone reductase (H+-translocating)